MDITTIGYVLEIAKTGSIGEAAQNLYQSPPSLSYAIKALEGEIGGALFTRSNRGMVLTQLGRQFLSYAQPFYRQYEYLSEISRSMCAVPAFSVVSSPLKSVSSAFVRLSQKHARQRCHLSFQETSVEDVLDTVQNGLADIGVIIFISEWSKTLQRLIGLKNLTYTALSKERPHVTVRVGHPLCDGDGKGVHWSQLEPYPYVTSYVGAFQYSFADQSGVVPQVGAKGQILVHSRACMHDMLHATDAYSISSGNRKAMEGKGFDDGIVTLPLEGSGFYLEMGCVKKEGAQLCELGVEFLAELRALLAPLTGLEDSVPVG